MAAKKKITRHRETQRPEWMPQVRLTPVELHLLRQLYEQEQQLQPLLTMAEFIRARVFQLPPEQPSHVPTRKTSVGGKKK